MSNEHRLYLGNLPASISEDEIYKQLGKYGQVLSVEIKHRDPLSFAYVNLEISSNELHKCFQEIGSREWNGNQVKIQLAKESFLDRLARERNSSVKSSEKTLLIENSSVNGISKHCNVTSNESLSKAKHQFKGLDSSDDDDEDTDHLVKKKVPMFKGTKRTSSGTYKSSASNDKSVLSPVKKVSNLVTLDFYSQSKSLQNSSTDSEKKDSFNDKVDHSTKKFKKNQKQEVVETNNKIEKNYDLNEENRRKQVSEEKRLKSIREKMDAFNKQKQVIKAGLSSIDSGHNANKKIKFHSDDEDDIPQVLRNNGAEDKKGQASLFDNDDSSGSEDNIQIKQQFEGKKGQRLLELQIKFGNDERFRLDERFQESSDEEESDEKETNPPEDKTEEQDEKSHSLQVLESVLGHSVTSITQKKPQQKNKVMIRYDPTKAEHQKFEIKENQEQGYTELERNTVKQKHSDVHGKQELELNNTMPAVSTEKFYKITDKLKDTFKTKDKSESFSLRQMFGSNEEDSEKEESSKSQTLSLKSNSEMRVKPKKKIKLGRNPFKYDSSDEEDTEEEDSAKTKSSEVTQRRVKDDFFFQPDDERFKETILMLDELEAAENKQDFSLVRRELKRITRQKIRRYKKSKDFPKRNNNKSKTFNNKFKANNKKYKRNNRKNFQNK